MQPNAHMQGANRTINSFFGTVYIINLRTRPDRRSEMAEQLERIGLGFESPNLRLFEAIKPDDPAGFPTVGARGCFMSHVAVLRDAGRRGASSVLILEDDLNFCENFGTRFSAIARRLEASDWGMFYGSYFLDKALEQSGAPCTPVDPQRLIGTSAFLAVNGNHIDALAGYLEAMLKRAPGDPQGGPMHIDGAYCWFRKSHPDVLTFLASNPLGFQRSSKTDVHPLRWYDSTAWSACVISRLRRWRNRLRG